MNAVATQLEPTIWHGCYDEGWGNLIVPDAFAHPAKFSCGLTRRIFKHGFEHGWWAKGDLIGDPFAGVGCGGLIAAGMDLRWIGMELEQRFVELARRNFIARGHEWGMCSCPDILQGDSRRFAEIIARCDAIVTSPPYAETATAKNSTGIDRRKQWETYRSQGGGSTYKAFAAQQEKHSGDYGHTPGQIGAMPASKLDAVVTSPPFADCLYEFDQTREDGLAQVAKRPCMRGMDGKTKYGGTEGQIGRDSGETYWQAVAQVYAQCRLALKPGGMLVVVVADYVKAGRKVPLCDQTLDLLQRIGFEPVQRIRAMMVKEQREAGLWEEHVTKTERKSFFRRLAERKGSPPKDWEEVLCVRAIA